MNIYSLLLCTILAGALILTLGHASYEAELDEQRTYCAMVDEGAWPDYKGNFKEVCHVRPE